MALKMACSQQRIIPRASPHPLIADGQAALIMQSGPAMAVAQRFDGLLCVIWRRLRLVARQET